MSLKLLISGASGFIGNAVLQRFSHAGYKIFALSRSAENKEKFSKMEVKHVIG